MKLKNFMFATMIACAFASCSEDDAVNNGPDQNSGKTQLVVDINSLGTKAALTAEEEKSINDLKVFLCDDQNQVIAERYVDAYGGNNTIVFDNITVGESYHCVGFANLGDVQSDALTSGVALAIENTDNGQDLPMHGASTVVPIVAGDNTATIYLTRDLARVELTKVTLDMNYIAPNESDFYQDKYTAGEVRFAFLGAYINSASKAIDFTTSFAPATENANSVVVAPSTTYTAASAFVGGLANWNWAKATNTNIKNTTGEALVTNYAIVRQAEASDYVIQMIGTPGANDNAGDYDGKDAPLPTDGVVFYVLPNTSTSQATVLTLNGDWSLKNGVDSNGNTNITDQSSAIYNLEIGAGTSVGANILANKNYKIEVIVTGSGDTTGGKRPVLKVKTIVTDWDDVSQTTPVK